MTVIEEEIDAMLFRLDRVVRGTGADELEAGRAHLDTAGGARILAELSSHRDGRLDGQLLKSLPDFGRDAVLHDDRLQHAGAVAQHDERDFARGAKVRDPASNRDGATDVLTQRLDTDE